MFTGIVEAVGAVESFDGSRLKISLPVPFHQDGAEVGESIAVNGCCLTLVGVASTLDFDLSPETVRRTTLGKLTPGELVNLERAMRIGARFDGHIVQGHVDGVAEIVSIEVRENARLVRFRVGEPKYLVDKGSVALDGISLTVVNLERQEFDTWIIPHTWNNTNLAKRLPGHSVNLEYDIVARYVERLLSRVS